MADLASWTVKSVPVETRQKAIKAANAAGQTMAAWLSETIERATDPHMANRVLPPGKPEPEPAAPIENLAGMAAILSVLWGVASAPELPKGVSRANAAASLNFYLRAARGQPGRRANRGQTLLENGQTMPLIEARKAR